MIKLHTMDIETDSENFINYSKQRLVEVLANRDRLRDRCGISVDTSLLRDFVLVQVNQGRDGVITRRVMCFLGYEVEKGFRRVIESIEADIAGHH